jgi:hypothetical protein
MLPALCARKRISPLPVKTPDPRKSLQRIQPLPFLSSPYKNLVSTEKIPALEHQRKGNPVAVKGV